MTVSDKHSSLLGKTFNIAVKSFNVQVPGANVKKKTFFFFVTNTASCGYAPGKLLESCLMFVSKARSLPFKMLH